jgi:hypothetical protein|tara:strand:+ start:370 stop:1056 length:687 start_codon:yes stop_codon:yes gene_type:complete
MIKKILFGSALALTALTSGATAASVDIDAYDNGWYNEFGEHVANNTNTIVGICCNNTEYHNWFAFDISALSGTATSASITFYVNGQYRSPDASETYQLNDYSGDIAALTAGGTGLTGIFDDLGDGDIYGSYEYAAAYGSNMVQFTIDLSLAALANINAALQGDGLFALGGMLTSLSGQQGSTESLFAAALKQPAAFLTIDTVSVPEPAPLALLGLGLFGLGLARKRRS